MDPPPTTPIRLTLKAGAALLLLSAGLGLFGMIMAYQQPGAIDVAARGEIQPEALKAVQGWMAWTAFAAGIPLALGLLIFGCGAVAYVAHMWRVRHRAGAWG